MTGFASATQEHADEAMTALAWAIYVPGRPALAQQAGAETGLGHVESKMIKNQRKTFGCLRDLMRVHNVGVIEQLPERGLAKYPKPLGVVVAVTPSTNPIATRKSERAPFHERRPSCTHDP